MAHKEGNAAARAGDGLNPTTHLNPHERDQRTTRSGQSRSAARRRIVALARNGRWDLGEREATALDHPTAHIAARWAA